MKTPLAPWAWSAILLLLVCLPRLSIDLYLPSLPAMADALHASDISMGMGLSPIVAPLAGSVLDAAFGWRAVFGVLCALGLLSLCLTLWHVPETRPATVASKQNVLALYRRLLGDACFLRYALAIGFVYCTYFPFIAESSVLLQRGMHLSPGAYALVFALTVSGYMAGSKLFQRWGAQQGADRMLGLAAGLNLAGAACQLAVLQPYGAQAGSASGLFFFVQMVITAACGALIAAISDGSARPMVWVTAGASAALVLVVSATRRRAAAQAVLTSRS